MVKCLNCGKEFEAKRIDAKYCGKLCRALGAKRNLSATDYAQPEELSATNLSATADAQLSATGPEIAQEIIEIVKEDSKPDTEQIIEQDLNIHDFGGNVDAYQAYVRQRNAQTRERILDTPIEQLKEQGQFIPAWKYELAMA